MESNYTEPRRRRICYIPQKEATPTGLVTSFVAVSFQNVLVRERWQVEYKGRKGEVEDVGS